MTSTSNFFAYARRRHQIYLDRCAGNPWPWSDDPILQKYRFCNVHREHDRTTQWFRLHIRDRLASSPDVLLATAVFRWFNRIETGERLMQYGEDCHGDAMHVFTRYTPEMHQDVYDHLMSHPGPHITGSYIIGTPGGMDKVHGVLKCLDMFVQGWRTYAIPRPAADLVDEIRTHRSLELAWGHLHQYRYLGDFMAYEIVTDLRHTDLLKDATDIHTWANPGPGARRGINRLDNAPLKRRAKGAYYVERMQDLLAASNLDDLWPHETLEMRDVEHSLCEFDKYERVRLNQGKVRRLYHHA